MIVWLIELILWVVVMRFFAEIGLWGSCIACAILHVIDAILVSATFSGIVTAFITGIIAGLFVYLMAKLGLFLIKVLGSIGSFLVGLFFVLALLAIIF